MCADVDEGVVGDDDGSCVGGGGGRGGDAGCAGAEVAEGNAGAGAGGDGRLSGELRAGLQKEKRKRSIDALPDALLCCHLDLSTPS